VPALRKYKIFISHAWDYSEEDYSRIVQFLDDSPNFEWENLSVPEHDPVKGELEYDLRSQMRPADVFLIIAGMYAAHSDWIDFELSFARRIGRPIIGIVKRGSERIPTAIQDAATEIVGWNGASIVAAIRKHALPTGS